MATRFTRGEIRKILGEAHTEAIENQLIALHLGVVDPLKDELQKAQESAEKLPDVQKELDSYKNGKNWKAEFDKEHQAFEDFKADAARKATLASKQAAFRKLLKAENIPDKFHDRIIKMTDFDGMEMDGEAIRDEAKQREGIRTEWGEYVATTNSQGAKPETPPSGDNTMTKQEILAIKDTSERQKAIAANLNLFNR